MTQRPIRILATRGVVWRLVVSCGVSARNIVNGHPRLLSEDRVVVGIAAPDGATRVGSKLGSDKPKPLEMTVVQKKNGHSYLGATSFDFDIVVAICSSILDLIK